jgi:hypothetical protein
MRYALDLLHLAFLLWRFKMTIFVLGDNLIALLNSVIMRKFASRFSEKPVELC